MVSTAPIITAMLSLFSLKERLRVWGWLGILISVLGSSLMTLSTGEGIHFSPGALFVLCAAVAHSLSFVLQKPYLARYSALQCTTYAIWAGTLALLVFSPGLVTNIRAASLSETAAALSRRLSSRSWLRQLGVRIRSHSGHTLPVFCTCSLW